MIFVERAREGRGQAFFRKSKHRDHDRTAGRRRPHFVPDADGLARPGGFAVHLDVPARAGVPSQSARFEDSCRGEPLIDAHGVHASAIVLSFRRGCPPQRATVDRF
jgi:hypothetical protein